jgi:signal transduction histidine kinase
VIRTAVELSSNPNTRPEKREEYSRMVLRELDRMVGMAQDLLSFARGERRMSRTEIDFEEFLKVAVIAWRQICGPEGIEVRCDCAVTHTMVAIDQDKIRRALDNIVINATEVLKAGGTIAIACRREGDNVAIGISDTGPGIPSDIRDMIFEPFATYGKEKGSGLGLAMAKKAVEDHGGIISLESAPGMGTTFTIRLPIGSLTRFPLHTEVGESNHASVTA